MFFFTNKFFYPAVQGFPCFMVASRIRGLFFVSAGCLKSLSGEDFRRARLCRLGWVQRMMRFLTLLPGFEMTGFELFVSGVCA